MNNNNFDKFEGIDSRVHELSKGQRPKVLFIIKLYYRVFNM